MTDSAIFKIAPFNYIHVLDTNNNITSVITGPQTFVLRDHQMVVAGPVEMIKIGPREFCRIANPVQLDTKGEVMTYEGFAQAKVRHGEEEIRTVETHPKPFPLYPLETLVKVAKVETVLKNTALKMTANRDFVDGDGVSRKAGDEWLIKGPRTYIPKVEAEILRVIKASVIKTNGALRIRALRDTTDVNKTARKAGEEWLFRECGSYLPGIDEEIVKSLRASILTDKKALHVRALRSFKDVYGVDRKAGQEWLVTIEMAESHIEDVNESIIGEVDITVLSNRQYCIVMDPVIDAEGNHAFGKKVLKKGEVSFFLKPGEWLKDNVQSVHVLGEDEALLLRALEDYTDEKKEQHKAGDKWNIYGPTEFIPPVEIEILERRQSIPLDENEGIYIRDMRTGLVKSIRGQTYMLKAHEELWEKNLPGDVEDLLARQKKGVTVASAKEDKAGKWTYEQTDISSYKRDKTRIVTFRAPHNSAVQVFDYKTKKSRVVFGPDLVMLEPDEQFSVITLSGSIPKVEGRIKNLATLLGPDFMRDKVVIETCDHARLAVELSYNWFFDIDKANFEDCQKIFSVKDFVGNACKAIASRVRGAASTVTFEHFHTHSAEIIKTAVFGKEKDGKTVKTKLWFPANKLVISNVDIHCVEPVDEKTRESLQKSVTLAIEITTKSQEASAKHQAERLAQEAMGQLERQKIHDQAEAERAKKNLLGLRAESESVKSSGQALAEARAKSEADRIRGQAEVEQSKLRSDARKIESDSELANLKKQNAAEIDYLKSMNELEVKKSSELAAIESKKFKQTINAIGRDTISAIARAGPELQAKLLNGLGLKGFMVMDGKNPINLFNTANGLMGSVVNKTA